MMGPMPAPSTAPSSPRWFRLLTVACLLPALFAACGETELPPPLPAEATQSVPTDRPAKKVLAAAVRRMRKSDTGTFTSAIGATRDQGSYRLSGPSAEVSRIIDGGESGKTGFTDSIRTPQGVWLRIRTASMNPKRVCWVRTGDALGTTTEDIPGAFAGAVGAALTAKGKRWNDEEIMGTVNLVQALLAVDPSLAVAPELLTITDARAKASFTVANGRLVGWSATSAHLLLALAKEGVELKGSLKPLSELDDFVVDVQFDRQGRKVTVSPPPPERVIAAEPADTLLKRGRACMRRK